MKSAAVAVALAACMLVTASAARHAKDDGVVYELLIFPKGCIETFLSGDLLNMACIKVPSFCAEGRVGGRKYRAITLCLQPTLSKFLGYGSESSLPGAAHRSFPQNPLPPLQSLRALRL